MVDTTDEWIFERTGIRERRIADADMGAAEMGARAARIAMERAGVQPGEIDVIVVSTATPDRLLPSTACDMQALLGATNAAAYDISAACSGFLYALSMAEGHIASGNAEIALVVSTEKMSGIVDWTTARHACCSAMAPAPPWCAGAQYGRGACCPASSGPTARWPSCCGGRRAA
jgi:3-oxoacyl-[acyl-carrier-protein] synthase III